MLKTEDNAALHRLNMRIRKIVSIHFHPDYGTPFWLDRAREMQIKPIEDIWTVEDLHELGPMEQSDLKDRELIDFIPRRFHSRLDQFVIGQTGGTTNQAVWTAYREDEFKQAFVMPFTQAAQKVAFPSREKWLFVGPSGPHFIGKVVRHLAGSLGSHDPFSVDFDPRWAKSIKEGSFAAKRYLQHVIDQAMDVIRQQQIGVIFTTPKILKALSQAMSSTERESIRGVHYGGMSMSPTELLEFQTRDFPNAIHLSGYGNTLFGCCLEHDVVPGRQLVYESSSDRLLLEVLDENLEACAVGETGQVYFTRLDESCLIVRFKERDEAEVSPESIADEGTIRTRVVNPRPAQQKTQNINIGLY